MTMFDGQQESWQGYLAQDADECCKKGAGAVTCTSQPNPGIKDCVDITFRG